MTFAALRLDVIAPHDLDRMLCEIGPLSLERDPGGTVVVIRESDAERAASILRRSGLSAQPAARRTPCADAIAAIVTHLRRLDVPDAFERITVEPMDIGSSTRLTRSRLLRRYDSDRLRPLLRDDDRAYRWRRVMWVPRRVIGTITRYGLRPIVFDRAALVSGHERCSFTRRAELAGWLTP